MSNRASTDSREIQAIRDALRSQLQRRIDLLNNSQYNSDKGNLAAWDRSISTGVRQGTPAELAAERHRYQTRLNDHNRLLQSNLDTIGEIAGRLQTAITNQSRLSAATSRVRNIIPRR